MERLDWFVHLFKASRPILQSAVTSLSLADQSTSGNEQRTIGNGMQKRALTKLNLGRDYSHLTIEIIERPN